MTHVLNSQTTFAAQSLRGFALAHPDLVTPVPGGVVRSDRPATPTVAVVTGGGSGHYPAFVGWVGPGMADGAAAGDVFASPSAEQICSVARAAENGAGVLLTYGNYAGDVLNFTEAQRTLESEGIRVRNLPITDDVTSAPPGERQRRRGTAGDLVVIKVAGASAAAGLDLDQVTDLASRANDRTLSFGIAFSGCTLPGMSQPLFSLAEGHMGVGMGVHGEPGISEGPIVTARELSELLVDRVLSEWPDSAGPQVLAMLNGLGATGNEELFVLWGEANDRLVESGVEPAFVEVGELVTSLDMAGLSLTLCWLDEDLRRAWTAPCRTAGFSRGWAVAAGQRREIAVGDDTQDATRTATAASIAQARLVLGVAGAVASMLESAEAELGALDAVAGDGDHGRGMARGARAAAEALAFVPADTGLGQTVAAAGRAWAAAAGGTSGALWGAALTTVGHTLGDDEPADAARILGALRAARDELVRRGGAEPGDKTMLDALDPFIGTLEARWADQATTLAAGWAAAAEAASEAATATAGMVARRGRARPLGERGRGHPDPGAVSLAKVLVEIGTVLGRRA